jgi:hypothetical protein
MDVSPGRRAVWVALADQFLDTETRHLIPSAALCCVEAGLAAEARAIWHHEVFPVVGHNHFEIAGDWAGWPEEWLGEQIAARRERRCRVADMVHRACARIGRRVFESRWIAIARCIRLLDGTPPPLRGSTAADLELLARSYFDFCPAPSVHTSTGRRGALQRLYRAAFLPIFAPLVVASGVHRPAESIDICAARVETLLSP